MSNMTVDAFGEDEDVDYLVNNVDEIIAKSNEAVDKILKDAHMLPRWKRFLIMVFPWLFDYDELRGWGN